jgi:polysaccharide pyruvyl transferase WcaK-like protein
MGGGPIMNVGSLSIIDYYLSYTRNRKIRTALLGCGVGPLVKPFYEKMAADILCNSDLSIFRDPTSLVTAKNLCAEYNKDDEQLFYFSHDPAILPVSFYLQSQEDKKNDDYIAINFRDFPALSFNLTNGYSFDQLFIDVTRKFSQCFKNVILTPMHTFSHGGDDRLYLSKIKQLSGCSNVEVIQVPQSVWQLFDTFYNATSCIGMRYHSIVFQTLLNGKNIIIDYTLPKDGKIISFLNLIGGTDHYRNSYFNLHEMDSYDIDKITFKESKFKFDSDLYNETTNMYTKKIISLLS